MKTFWRTTAALTGALASVFVTGGAAQAETGWGEPNLGCTNSVTIQHSAGRVYAYGVLSCDRDQSGLVPEVGLAGGNGKFGYESNITRCSWTDYCRTSLVSLPEIPGVNYTAGNGGAIDEKIWPPETWANTSLTGQTVPWEAGDYPVAGNWDGGPDGVGIWRPSNGEFHLRGDNGNLMKVYWGQSGDVPISGNWDSGPDNLGVWRPSTGEFHLRMDDGSLVKIGWGIKDDIPVAGNWDGGPDNVGVYLPNHSEFQLRMDNGSLTKVPWGDVGDIPVSGNWDGSGPDNVGVWRPDTGEFHLRGDSGNLIRLYWGQKGDIPVSGNWDGGAAENVGIWRPSTGEFHLRMDNGNLVKIGWGNSY